MTSYPTTESRAVVEAIQAQLASYIGVDARIEVLDFAGATAKLSQRQYQAIINGLVFLDPEITVWNSLHSAGPANYVGLADPALDAALDAGRTTADPAARKAAYTTAAERIAAQHPFLLYVRTAPAVVLAEDLHGVELYGIGSLLPEHLWTENGP
jgi:peptide/nickel transport system substrate-binding protein